MPGNGIVRQIAFEASQDARLALLPLRFLSGWTSRWRSPVARFAHSRFIEN